MSSGVPLEREEQIRADERRRIADQFRSIAARFEEAKKTATNMGQIWSATSQAMQWEQAANLVDGEDR